MSAGAIGARAAVLLAAPDDNIPPGQGPEWGKAAPIGLLIILLLGLSLFFLIKNMNKQFRKVPDSFDPPPDEVIESPDEIAEEADSSDEAGAADDPVSRAGDDAADRAGAGSTDRGDAESSGASVPPAGEQRG